MPITRAQASAANVGQPFTRDIEESSVCTPPLPEDLTDTNYQSDKENSDEEITMEETSEQKEMHDEMYGEGYLNNDDLDEFSGWTGPNYVDLDRPDGEIYSEYQDDATGGGVLSIQNRELPDLSPGYLNSENHKRDLLMFDENASDEEEHESVENHSRVLFNEDHNQSMTYNENGETENDDTLHQLEQENDDTVVDDDSVYDDTEVVPYDESEEDGNQISKDVEGNNDMQAEINCSNEYEQTSDYKVIEEQSQDTATMEQIENITQGIQHEEETNNSTEEKENENVVRDFSAVTFSRPSETVTRPDAQSTKKSSWDGFFDKLEGDANTLPSSSTVYSTPYLVTKNSAFWHNSTSNHPKTQTDSLSDKLDTMEFSKNEQDNTSNVDARTRAKINTSPSVNSKAVIDSGVQLSPNNGFSALNSFSLGNTEKEEKDSIQKPSGKSEALQQPSPRKRQNKKTSKLRSQSHETGEDSQKVEDYSHLPRFMQPTHSAQARIVSGKHSIKKAASVAQLSRSFAGLGLSSMSKNSRSHANLSTTYKKPSKSTASQTHHNTKPHKTIQTASDNKNSSERDHQRDLSASRTRQHFAAPTASSSAACKSDRYQSLAEGVHNFFSRTPKRFHSKPRIVESLDDPKTSDADTQETEHTRTNTQKLKPKLTVPHEPKCHYDERAKKRAENAPKYKTREEEEEEYMQSIKPFKASEYDPQQAAAVTHVSVGHKKSLTIPYSPKFKTKTRSARSTSVTTATNAHKFKARPVPKSMFKPQTNMNISLHKNLSKADKHMTSNRSGATRLTNVPSASVKTNSGDSVSSPKNQTSSTRFKARPMPNFSIHSNKMTETQKTNTTKRRTEPKPFQLRSDQRHNQYVAATKEKQLNEEAKRRHLTHFKARAVPKSTRMQTTNNNSGNGGNTSNVRATLNRTTAKSSVVSKSQTTNKKPGLSTTAMTKRIQSVRPPQRPTKSTVSRYQEVVVGGNTSTATEATKGSHVPTAPQPFKLLSEERHAKAVAEEKERIAAEHAAAMADASKFRARPIPVSVTNESHVFKPVKQNREPLISSFKGLATDKRSEARREYDLKQQQRWQAMEEAKRQEEAHKQREEEEAIRRMRREEMMFKAQPANTAPPEVAIQISKRPLTIPESPMLSTKQRSQMRGEREAVSKSQALLVLRTAVNDGNYTIQPNTFNKSGHKLSSGLSNNDKRHIEKFGTSSNSNSRNVKSSAIVIQEDTENIPIIDDTNVEPSSDLTSGNTSILSEA